MSGSSQHTRTQKRNIRLVSRFYFYSSIVGLKFSRVTKHLEDEFEISESRIVDIISENNQYLSFHERQGTLTSKLRNIYPFMNWKYVPPTKLKTTAQQLLFQFSETV